MIYLAETELSKNKPVIFALADIYGIGHSTSKLICKKLGFSINLKVKDLSEEQTEKLLEITKSLKLILAGDLRKLKLLNSKKLVDIKSYRGLRRVKGFPVRGQRTHTNAKTARKNARN